MLKQIFLALKICVFIFCLSVFLNLFISWNQISLIWQIPLFRLCHSPLLPTITIDITTDILQNAVPAMYISSTQCGPKVLGLIFF
jgi:hypothetical protein